MPPSFASIGTVIAVAVQKSVDYPSRKLARQLPRPWRWSTT